MIRETVTALQSRITNVDSARNAIQQEFMIVSAKADSLTQNNLQLHGEGVLHVTDDVLLLAQAALGPVEPLPPLRVASQVRGWVLQSGRFLRRHELVQTSPLKRAAGRSQQACAGRAGIHNGARSAGDQDEIATNHAVQSMPLTAIGCRFAGRPPCEAVRRRRSPPRRSRLR